jgi:hypothetical protein|tara:strand:- start:635 stop:925 length:291 start_codon:yes stop_codon:yes gene_type:complete
MAINRSNIKLQVTRGNKMKQLKDVPEGNKGKGLSKLPTAVRNKMGFKKQGGSLTDDIKKIKKRKGGGMVYQLYGGSTKDFSDGNKFIQSFYDKGGK